MKALQENQSTTEQQSFIQASHESQSDQKNNDNAANEAPAADSGSVSVSVSSNEGRRVSREDIELVQNLIERCLQLYMNKDEVVKTLLTRARIDPSFTSLVWQKLEEENADFFRAYYIRLKLKKQIIMFNHLIEHQYRMSKCTVPSKAPLAPAQNGLNPMPPVNNLPMGYPVLQPHPVPVPGQSYLNLMGHEVSSCHMVKGVPASGNFQPLRMNSANDMVIENSSVDAAPVIPPSSGMSTMSDMPISPTSVASSGHFPFTAPEITGMEIPWTFSLSDLTADLSNLGDLGPLGNYPGSPFLPSDSDILLDSPEPEDIVEEFFVDSVPGPPFAPSDEEKP